MRVSVEQNPLDAGRTVPLVSWKVKLMDAKVDKSPDVEFSGFQVCA